MRKRGRITEVDTSTVVVLHGPFVQIEPTTSPVSWISGMAPVVPLPLLAALG